MELGQDRCSLPTEQPMLLQDESGVLHLAVLSVAKCYTSLREQACNPFAPGTTQKSQLIATKPLTTISHCVTKRRGVWHTECYYRATSATKTLFPKQGVIGPWGL